MSTLQRFLLLSAVAVCFCSLKAGAADVLVLGGTVSNGNYDSQYQLYCSASPVTRSTALSSCQALDSSGRTWWLGTVKSAASMAWVKSAGAAAQARNSAYPNVWLSGSRTLVLVIWTDYSWTTGRNSGVSFSSGSSLLSGYTGLNWDPSSGQGEAYTLSSPNGLYSLSASGQDGFLFPSTQSSACYVCERNPCSFTLDNPTTGCNLVGTNTMSGYWSETTGRTKCGCLCKSTHRGPKCQFTVTATFSQADTHSRLLTLTSALTSTRSILLSQSASLVGTGSVAPTCTISSTNTMPGTVSSPISLTQSMRHTATMAASRSSTHPLSRTEVLTQSPPRTSTRPFSHTSSNPSSATPTSLPTLTAPPTHSKGSLTPTASPRHTLSDQFWPTGTYRATHSSSPMPTLSMAVTKTPRASHSVSPTLSRTAVVTQTPNPTRTDSKPPTFTTAVSRTHDVTRSLSPPTTHTAPITTSHSGTVSATLRASNTITTAQTASGGQPTHTQPPTHTQRATPTFPRTLTPNTPAPTPAAVGAAPGVSAGTTTGAVVGVVSSPFSGPDALTNIQVLAIFAVMQCRVPGVGSDSARSMLSPLAAGAGRFKYLVGQLLLIVGVVALYAAAIGVVSLITKSYTRAKNLLRHPRALPLLHLVTLPGLTFESAMVAYGNDPPITAAERAVGCFMVLVCILSVALYVVVLIRAHREHRISSFATAYSQANLNRFPRLVVFALLPKSWWDDEFLHTACVVAAPLRPSRAMIAGPHGYFRVLLVALVCAVRPGEDGWCDGILITAALICFAHAGFLLLALPYRVPINSVIQFTQSAIVGVVAVGNVAGFSSDVSGALGLTIVGVAILSVVVDMAVFLIEWRVLKTFVEVGEDEELPRVSVWYGEDGVGGNGPSEQQPCSYDSEEMLALAAGGGPRRGSATYNVDDSPSEQIASESFLSLQAMSQAGAAPHHSENPSLDNTLGTTPNHNGLRYLIHGTRSHSSSNNSGSKGSSWQRSPQSPAGRLYSPKDTSLGDFVRSSSFSAAHRAHGVGVTSLHNEADKTPRMAPTDCAPLYLSADRSSRAQSASSRSGLLRSVVGYNGISAPVAAVTNDSIISFQLHASTAFLEDGKERRASTKVEDALSPAVMGLANYNCGAVNDSFSAAENSSSMNDWSASNLPLVGRNRSPNSSARSPSLRSPTLGIPRNRSTVRAIQVPPAVRAPLTDRYLRADTLFVHSLGASLEGGIDDSATPSGASPHGGSVTGEITERAGLLCGRGSGHRSTPE